MESDKFAEDLRILSLCALGILDTPQEARFDRLTRLAAASFNVPIALVSLVDRNRQWFKSRFGLDATQTPRAHSFCSHAIGNGALLMVDDASKDPRFRDNPLVTHSPNIRFYAGHPIYNKDGVAVGTLCLIDQKPRTLDLEELARLADFAVLVEHEIERHTEINARIQAESALYEMNQELEQRIAERTGSLQERNDALHREIRQRREVELTLRRSEERIRSIIDCSFSAFISTDAVGRIIEWNAAAERTFGWLHDEVIGSDLSHKLIPARHLRAHFAALEGYRRAGIGLRDQKRHKLAAMTKSGDEIMVEMTVSAFNMDGELHFGAFLHNVSDSLKTQKALEQKQELLDAVLESVDVGVIACDADGNLTLFNRAAREFHGKQPGQQDASDWAEKYDLFQSDGKTPLPPQDIPLLRALGGESVKDAEIVISPKGMKKRLVLSSGRSLVSPSGERLGAVVAMKDITEHSEWQGRLRTNAQRLTAIAENLPTLIGQVDREGRFVYLNSRALRFYGQSAVQLIGQPVSRAYSPSDFARVKPFVDIAMQGQKAVFEDEMQLGSQRFFYHASYVPNFDAHGAPDGFFAMAFDITARRESELRKAESEERLRTITNNLPILISYLDRDYRFQFANGIYDAWLGVDSKQMINRTIAEVFGEAFFIERKPSLDKCLRGHTTELEIKVVNEGRERIITSSYIPHLRDGAVVGIYVLSSDSTAVHEHQRQLLLLANTDPLTGLPNRRKYEDNLEAALSRLRRHGTGLGLMYLDLDNFKKINDTLGHEAGDEVLKEFAQRLKLAVRETDLVARLAGDEFTILLDTVNSREDCKVVGQKILHALHEPFMVRGKQLRVTTSIGVGFSRDRQETALMLAREADTALYKAKLAGKGRCEVLASRAPKGAALVLVNAREA